MTKKSLKPFGSREERAIFIKESFKDYINNSDKILDVGCWNNDLKKLIGNNITGIDIGGKPDITYDLENKINIFEDNSFDLLICTEVLEHVNNFHQLFNELVRISNNYIIISLPNVLDFTKRINFLFGKTGNFYGLPKKSGGDRHRWLFSYNQINDFMKDAAQKNNLEIVEKFPHYTFLNLIKFPGIKSAIKLSLLSYPNLFAQSYWIVLKKK